MATDGKLLIATSEMMSLLTDDEMMTLISHLLAHHRMGHIKQRFHALSAGEKISEVSALMSPGVSAERKLLGPLAYAVFNTDEEAAAVELGIDYAKNAGVKGVNLRGLWAKIEEQKKRGLSAHHVFTYYHPLENSEQLISLMSK